MNKHVAKLLQPGVFWYCLIMLAFAAAAALFDQYYLAVGELVVTVIAMVVSRLLSVRRRNALMRYVQSATDAEGISVHAGSVSYTHLDVYKRQAVKPANATD